MNKKFLALAISAATMATSAYAADADGKQAGSVGGTTVYSSGGNSLEIGGRAEGRLSMVDGTANDNSRVRFSLLGKTEIMSDFYGVGFYEGEFTTADKGAGNDIDHRYVYAGFGGEFGEVSYGKNDGALGVVTDFTDIMAYHGNSAAEKLSVSDRTDNMITYKGQFSELNVKASYRFADSVVTPAGGLDDNAQDGYSLSGVYALSDSFKLGAGIASQASADEMMFAASYQVGSLYVAGTYTNIERLNSDKYTGYEFAAAYKMDQLVTTMTYNSAEEASSTTADNIAVDATYYFKPNFRTYVSYNMNMLDEKDVTAKYLAEDELVLGMRYDF